MAANTNATQSIMEINVLMLGGRRCGKTSILAAMQECFDNMFGNTDLTIAPADAETMMKLDEKREELKSYYLGDKYFVPDDNATSEYAYYNFYISLKSKKASRVKLKFTDFNGEFMDEAAKIDFDNGEVANLVKESDVIMVAIDTPYLMEALPDDDIESVGLYNNRKNKCTKIDGLIRNCFQADKTTREKMIIFVPLKCEKYYWSRSAGNPFPNDLAITAIRLKAAFGNLLEYLTQENNRRFYEVAITPIMTMGNVIFSGFKREINPDTGEREYIMNKIYNYPLMAEYQVRETASQDKVTKPAPKFCEQPFIYVILYMLRLTQKQLSAKEKAGIPGLNFLVNAAKKALGYAFAEDFAAQEATLLKNIKTNRPPHQECGFEIITDPIRLEQY